MLPKPARVFAVLLWVFPLTMAPFARADNETSGAANIGERLFLETRFAEFFFTNSGGDANAPFTDGGDPVMATTESIYGPLPGPFAGQAMNCRACHMVEEQEATGNRVYADFAPRSPVPNNGDGRMMTTRNAMGLVDSFIPRGNTPFFLHFDGQFATTQDLIIGTLTGRNYGWKPTEYQTAIHQIANIIRNDAGTNALAEQYGGWSYATIFSTQVEPQYSIPTNNYMDVTITDTNDPAYVTDAQIVQNVASLIEQYLLTLVFAQNTKGAFVGSPFDVFLMTNGLPQQPNDNETPIQYSHRLLRLVAGMSNPKFVTPPGGGRFFTNVHGQPYQFGTNELAGLIIFLTDSTALDIATNQQLSGITTGIEVGNCATCHTPPAFTDFIFHNNGAAQEEYDSFFGAGAFAALSVPGYSTRQTNYDAWLPPTTNHPDALGTFETPPNSHTPGLTDLGLWNVFANPDFPAPQAGLQQILPQLLAVPSPQITQAKMAGNSFVVGGTNGMPGWSYYVINSTDPSAPLGEWQVIATNTFDGSGNFSFTNAMAQGAPHEFFALTLAPITPDLALPGTIALFKTPTVRDLVASEPYLHTGRKNTIEDVLAFYQSESAQARAGTLRNADPQLKVISLDNSAVAPLAAFLRSLDEAAYVDIPCPCGGSPTP